VEDLEAVRGGYLKSQQNLVDLADKEIARCERERQWLENEAEFFENKKKPESLKRDMDANEEALYRAETAESTALKKMVSINEEFDAKRKRYLELTEVIAKAAEARARHKVDEAAK